jgi:hypothetical protein
VAFHRYERSSEPRLMGHTGHKSHIYPEQCTGQTDCEQSSPQDRQWDYLHNCDLSPLHTRTAGRVPLDWRTLGSRHLRCRTILASSPRYRTCGITSVVHRASSPCRVRLLCWHLLTQPTRSILVSSQSASIARTTWSSKSRVTESSSSFGSLWAMAAHGVGWSLRRC